MPLRSLSVALFAALLAAAPAAAQSDPVAVVTGGTVAGVEAGGVAAFKGIPYAAPPVGDLRWRAPQPVAAWDGIRSAADYGHDCMQVPVESEAALVGATPSEDCLFVNVWRPADAAAGAGLPVMIWIHGGGFTNGGGSAPVNDGSALARRGLVVVSLNYRLGRLGFFAHPALLAAAEGQVGNFGYMDQIAALRWVQANVAAFGGDPAKVTIVGESAGGASVLQLLTSPVAGGLFRAAMAMSGGGRDALSGRRMTGGTPAAPSADQTDAAFAESLGIAGADAAALATLRALPAESIIGDVTINTVIAEALAGAKSVSGTPMVDGTIVTDQPGAILARGEAAPVPLMIGTTALDLPLFFPPDRADPFAWFGPDADRARGAYNPIGVFPPEFVLAAIGADMTMHEPARFAAGAMVASGNPAWLYRFTYAADSNPQRALGAAHSQEVAFLFDTVDIRYGAAATDNDRKAAAAFSSYVANFVAFGDPNGAGLPDWPRFDAAGFNLMNFTQEDGPMFGADPRALRIELVERAYAAAAATARDAAAGAGAAPAALIGPVWEWLGLAAPGETIAVADPARYTLQFEEGQISMGADCNRAGGAYTRGAGDAVAFGALAMTRAFCGTQSLSNRFVGLVTAATRVTVADDELHLDLPDGGGTLRFRKQ